MDVEISISCFGENIGKTILPKSHDIFVEKSDRHLSLVYKKSQDVDLDEMMTDFLDVVSGIDFSAFDSKLFRVAFFVYPSDGVAFFSTEIGGRVISVIEKMGADLEVSFYPCSE